MPKSAKQQIQQDEITVLAELQKNCNGSIDSIAKRCGFSRQKVWKIIKRLEASQTIWGYSAITDEQKQGLEKYIMFFKRSSQTFTKNASEQVSLDAIQGAYLKIGIRIESSHYIHGDYDWILIFTAKDLVTAKKFISLILGKYSGLIENIHLARILYTPRNHYVLNPTPLKAKDII